MILCKLFNDNDYNNGNNNDGIADDDYKSDSGDHCGYVISWLIEYSACIECV